jgi:hypothetical protein
MKITRGGGTAGGKRTKSEADEVVNMIEVL